MISLKRWTLVATLMLAMEAAGAQELTKQETAVARAVDKNNQQAVSLLERIVNINSGTQNFVGVKQVADVLRAQLDSLGFTTKWVDGSSWKRAGHLVGAQYAIGFEDGAMDPRTAVIARRSAGGWTLRVTGTPAHSGQIFKPNVGAGAVYETSRILHEFYTRLSSEQRTAIRLVIRRQRLERQRANTK